MTFLNPPHFDDPFALLAELHLHIDALETARDRTIRLLADVPDDRHPL